MSVLHSISLFGCIISLVLGLVAAIKPTKIESLVSVTIQDDLGLSEVRATYGGFFVGMSLFCLLTSSSMAFAALACGWLGAAMVRFISILSAKSQYKKICIAGVFETVIGFMIVAGSIT